MKSAEILETKEMIDQLNHELKENMIFKSPKNKTVVATVIRFEDGAPVVIFCENPTSRETVNDLVEWLNGF